MLPKRRFWRPEQRLASVLFERIFNESPPKSNTHTLEKYFKNTDAVRTLRLVRLIRPAGPAWAWLASPGSPPSHRENYASKLSFGACFRSTFQGRDEQTVWSVFSKQFSTSRSPNRDAMILCSKFARMITKDHRIDRMLWSFVIILANLEHKTLDVRTNRLKSIFEALFNTPLKSASKRHDQNVGWTFQNLRLGSIEPARMITKDHRMRTMRCVAFSGMLWSFVTSL